MENPWLQIPAADYEAHMSSPNVDQLAFLGRTFKAMAYEAGLLEKKSEMVSLESGKSFHIGTYIKN